MNDTTTDRSRTAATGASLRFFSSNRALRAFALPAALACYTTGCESPDIDAQNFRCEQNDDCGPGWQCNTEPSLSRCVRAYDGVNGVFDDRLVLGLVADLGDSAIGQLGQAGVAGYRAFFARVNAAGGVHGRRIVTDVRSADYLDPGENEKQIKELITGADREAFALSGVLGSAPSLVAQQIAIASKVLFFAPGTGADVLEPSPPDRYVFNVRLRYSQEAAQLARVLIRGALDQKAIPPENMGVFAQGSASKPGTLDDFGQGGANGVRRAVSGAGGNPDEMEIATYRLVPKGTDILPEGVEAALTQLLKWMASPDRGSGDKSGKIPVGIVLAALGDVAAPFTINLGKALDQAAAGVSPEDFAFAGFSQDELDQLKHVDLQLASLSSVGLELIQLLIDGAGGGKRYGAGMIIASPMPSPISNATGVRQYREDLKQYFPELQPSSVSLEGYINARLLHAALEKHGRDLTTESIITTLLTLSVDLGIGTQLRFSSERHQATDVVWGVRLDDDLTPKALDRSLTDMLEQ